MFGSLLACFRPRVPFVCAALLSVLCAQAKIVISEIQYHPATHLDSEDFIELQNIGTEPVNLAGWQFNQGVTFTFPSVQIPKGGFLVISANTNAFRTRYGSTIPVIGNWTGRLNESSERIRLVNTAGVEISSVTYSTEGDWGVRTFRYSNEHGGWLWRARHDGQGRTAELVNPLLPVDSGLNWAASARSNGSPGTTNGAQVFVTAPLIKDFAFAPLVPTSADPITIRVKVAGLKPPLVVKCLYRIDGATTNFTALEMKPMEPEFPGQFIEFIASLPPQPNNAVLEFKMEATDGTALLREWPSAPDLAGALVENATVLLQVDDFIPDNRYPFYRIIMRDRDREELAFLGSRIPDAWSSAQFNATFISHDADGITARTLVDVRNRGSTAASQQPNSYRVNFRPEDPWRGNRELIINGQMSFLQLAGGLLALKSHVPALFPWLVNLRVNNRDLTGTGPSDRTYGLYVAMQTIDSAWSEDMFPNDPNGNLYRGVRDGDQGAEFQYLGSTQTEYEPFYDKTSNATLADYSDIVGLCRAFSGATSNSRFLGEIHRVLDVDEWLRYFALNEILDNNESTLNTGSGDDYFLYRGMVDQRFLLGASDFDSILGFNSSRASPTAPIMRPISISSISRLLRHAEILPRYHATFRGLLGTVFQDDLVDSLIRQHAPDLPVAPREKIVEFVRLRRAYILSQIPAALTVRTSLAVTNSIHYATNNTASLRGSAAPFLTARITVNGLPANLPRISSAWTHDNFPLQTGLNELRVESWNAAGTLLESVLIKVQAPEVPADPPAAASPAPGTLVISEFLAQNLGAATYNGRNPDLIELHNRSDSPINLGGLGLTDEKSRPYKYQFPATLNLEPGAFLVIAADRNVSGLRTGFALDRQGDALFLYDAASRGGALLDSITFGNQLGNFSSARADDGTWRLGTPSFGEPNVFAAAGPAGGLRINEWLAKPFTGEDYFELYNPHQHPVDLGLCWLSDNFLGYPLRYQLPPLSFVPAGAHIIIDAGGTPSDGGGEVNFKLSPHRGMISICDPQGRLMDSIIYGPQRTGITEGRAGDGDPRITTFASSTLGNANPGSPTGDWDNDGLPDRYEMDFKLNPQYGPDAGWDSDSDGISNLNEYRTRTDPTNPASVFKLALVSTAAGRLLEINVPAQSAVRLELSTDLGTPWSTHHNFPAHPTNRLETFTLPDLSTFFFRLARD